MSDPDRSLSLHQRFFGTSCSWSRLKPGPVPEEAWLVDTTPGTFVVTVEVAKVEIAEVVFIVVLVFAPAGNAVIHSLGTLARLSTGPPK